MIRGRFAPSPTGELHLGNARTALLAWLQIRAAGGQFILRVEDLDPGRVRQEYLEGQLEELRWLGLDWDEGPDVGGPFAPYLQSERSELYREALRRLQEMGRIFECFCTRREVAEAASAPNGPDDEGPRYPGTCRHLGPEQIASRRKRRASALRYLPPPGPVTFDDEVAGHQRFNPLEETGAFVVRRKDEVAGYQLAVVVDDAAMGITHVLRGADLLPSTARQIQLYRDLLLEPPIWAHVPLMLGENGDRLAKRDGARSLTELRGEGVDSRRVVGWLAWTAGLIPNDEPVSPRELIPRFDLARLRRETTHVSSVPF